MNLRAARAALAEAARSRVTTIQDNSSIDALPTYQDLRARGELTARFYVWRYACALEPLRKAGVRTGLGDDWIRLGALKILADGSMGSGTAAFFEPYADDPDARPPAPPRGGAGADDRGGGRRRLPARGPRHRRPRQRPGSRRLREGGARQRPARPTLPHRARPGGAQGDLPRYKALGVIASIQPSHCIDDMRWAEKRIGARALPRRVQLPLVHRAGIPVAFGTDWFVEPLDPRLGLYAAVTREFPAGGPRAAGSPRRRSLSRTRSTSTRGARPTRSSRRRTRARSSRQLADLVVFARTCSDSPRARS